MYLYIWVFPGGSVGKEPTVIYKESITPTMRDIQETWVQSLGWEDHLEEGMQPTPVFLPEESSWTEEAGWLQSVGLQRVRQDWSYLACMHARIFVYACSPHLTPKRACKQTRESRLSFRCCEDREPAFSLFFSLYLLKKKVPQPLGRDKTEIVRYGGHF